MTDAAHRTRFWPVVLVTGASTGIGAALAANWFAGRKWGRSS